MTTAQPAVGSGIARVPSPSLAPAGSGGSRWHVSPAVDLLGYAFSWLLLAVPVYLVLGSEVLAIRDYRPEGYLFIVMAVVLIDVHRHFTFPYVYLDRRIRRRFPLRFWLLPAVLAVLFTQMPTLSQSQAPLGIAGASAIAVWLVVLLQLLRLDPAGGRARRDALLVALGAAALGALASKGNGNLATPPHTSLGWIWLLCGSGACLFIAWGSAARVPAGVAPSVPGARASGHRRARRWVLPGGVLGLIALSAAWQQVTTLSAAVSVVVIVYVLWLAHHVISQKYGILRIYSTKSGHPTKVPGWVDRTLVWSWLPMFLVWTVGESPDTISRYFDGLNRGTSRLVLPVVSFVDTHFHLLFAAATAMIVASIGTFLRYEWKIHRLRNTPRLAFAAGTMLFYSGVFVIGIVGTYVAFAATHCIEYMTFIWALQRRRYQTFDREAPVLSWLVHSPLLYYGGIFAVVSIAMFLARYGYRYLDLSRESLMFFGEPIYSWAFWYSILQAFLHFYYDGFLWKMKPELTRSL